MVVQSRLQQDSRNRAVYIVKTSSSEALSAFVKIAVPSVTTVNYGNSLILHADVENLPVGAKIVWTADNTNFAMDASSDGLTCTVSPNVSGDTIFTAKIIDKDNNILSSDTIKITAKASLWYKILSFFKRLFNLNEIIPFDN